MSNDEFELTHIGMLRELPAPSNVKETPAYGLQTSVDRGPELGPALDMCNCGRCLTFYTVAVIESCVNVKCWKSLDLAGQHPVDYDKTTMAATAATWSTASRTSRSTA